MLVHVKLLARLGNNLFQYPLGRTIAEHLGFELVCEPGSTSGVTLATVSNHFPNAALSLVGQSFASPIQEFNVHLDNACDGQALDLNAVLRDRTPRLIKLAGYFQRLQYFASFKAEIRK